MDHEAKLGVVARNLYKLDIKKCSKGPAAGGLRVKELRKLAVEIGLDAEKVNKLSKLQICQDIERLMNLPPEAPKKVQPEVPKKVQPELPKYKYPKDIKNCIKGAKQGGLPIAALREVAVKMGINYEDVRKMNKAELCKAVENIAKEQDKKINVDIAKEQDKIRINAIKVPPKAPKKKIEYPGDIKKCKQGPSAGGLAAKELRRIALEMGLSPDIIKNNTKIGICNELEKLIKEKEKEEEKEKKKAEKPPKPNLPKGCIVDAGCPAGYKRKELAAIAQKCGIELKRPVGTLKSTKELCAEILAKMKEAGVENVARKLEFGPIKKDKKKKEKEKKEKGKEEQFLKVRVQDVFEKQRQQERAGVDMLDLNPAIPDPNYEDREYQRLVTIYNRILKQAKKHNKKGELDSFLILLSRLKDIVQNQHNYRLMFLAIWKDSGESQAINWLKNVLFKSGFACHPYDQDFAAKDYVEASFNALYPVLEQFNSVLDEFPESVIIKLGERVHQYNNGVCLENLIKAFEDAISGYQIVQTQYLPESPKDQNIGNYANDYRSNQCLVCNMAHNKDSEKVACIKPKLTQGVIREFLVGKLENKMSKNGRIQQGDIDDFLGVMHDMLVNCDGMFDVPEDLYDEEEQAPKPKEQAPEKKKIIIKPK